MSKIEQLENGSRRVVLAHPIHDGREEIEAVVLRPPVARDMRKMDSERGDVGKMVVLVATLTGLPVVQVESLHVEDFMVCSKVVGEWLGKSLETGGTS